MILRWYQTLFYCLPLTTSFNLHSRPIRWVLLLALLYRGGNWNPEGQITVSQGHTGERWLSQDPKAGERQEPGHPAVTLGSWIQDSLGEEWSGNSKCSPTPACRRWSEPPGHLPPTGHLCGRSAPSCEAAKSPLCLDFLPVEICSPVDLRGSAACTGGLRWPWAKCKDGKIPWLAYLSHFLCPLKGTSQPRSLFLPSSAPSHACRRGPSLLLKLSKSSEMHYCLDKQTWRDRDLAECSNWSLFPEKGKKSNN